MGVKGVFAGIGLIAVGIGLMVWGDISERTPMFVSGLVLTLLGPVVLVVSFVVAAESSKRREGYLAPFSNRKAYLEAVRGERTFEAAVRSSRTVNLMGGTTHFGTEIVVDVLLDDDVVEGVVREYLTPAQLAVLGPGADLRVKPVPAYPGQYVIARADEP